MKVYATLDGLGITYDQYAHPPIFTSEDAAEHWAGIDGAKVKNLFLRNKKGDRHYLVILEVSQAGGPAADREDRRRRSPELRIAGAADGAHSGITPGSVSPFGLIHDTDRRGTGGHRRGAAVARGV